MAANWAALSEAVAAALGTFETDTVLVLAVHPPPGVPYYLAVGYFVQFAQRGDHLRAEAVADVVLPPALRVGVEGATRLAALGWNAPLEDDDLNQNWWLDVPWPVPSAGYRRLGELAVASLRDVFGIGSPADLGYRAWIDGRPRPGGLELPGLELARLPG